MMTNLRALWSTSSNIFQMSRKLIYISDIMVRRDVAFGGVITSSR